MSDTRTPRVRVGVSLLCLVPWPRFWVLSVLESIVGSEGSAGAWQGALVRGAYSGTEVRIGTCSTCGAPCTRAPLGTGAAGTWPLLRLAAACPLKI